MEDFVAFSRMKNELKRVPSASEPKMAKTQIEIAKNICDFGNHRFANFVDPLIIKQNPNEQRNVPRQKK